MLPTFKFMYGSEKEGGPAHHLMWHQRIIARLSRAFLGPGDNLHNLVSILVSCSSNLFPDATLVLLPWHSCSFAPHKLYSLVTGYLFYPTSIILRVFFSLFSRPSCGVFSFPFWGLISSLLLLFSLSLPYIFSLKHSDGLSCDLCKQIYLNHRIRIILPTRIILF